MLIGRWSGPRPKERRIGGQTFTLLTTEHPFDGNVTVGLGHYSFADVDFGDGTPIVTSSPPVFRQDFNVSNAHPWFSTPFRASSITLFSPNYAEGHAEFDRFLGSDMIALHLALEGRTDLVYPPTPDFIGRETGSEWVVDVAYTFVPAPGPVVFAGVAALFARSRRR